MYLSPSLSRWQSRPFRSRFLTTGAVLSILILTLFLVLRDSGDVGKYVIKTQPLPLSQDAGNGNTAGSVSGDGNGGGNGGGGGGQDGPRGWEFVVDRDGDNYGLSEEQCQIAFPKLYHEVDKTAAARKKNHISWKEVDSTVMENGMVRAFVHHGEVSLLWSNW